MPQTINLFLTPQQFFALGSQISGERSKLSPFGRTASGAHERVLNPELVTGEGQLRADLAPVFQVLASARSFCVIGYSGRLTNYEMASYYPGQAASQDGVSLVYLGDGLQIQSPPSGGDAFELMHQYLGETVLQHIELEMDLPILEAWLLFAVVDAGRKKSLERLLNTEMKAVDELTSEDIFAGLESKKTGLQWLAPYFDACLSLATPTQSEISAGLKRLVSQGLLSSSGTHYLPGEPVQQLIAEFLLVDGHLRIRAAALNQAGEAVSADVRAIQGRSGSILIWSHDAVSVNLRGASPAQLLVLIDSLMQNPGQTAQPAGQGSSQTLIQRHPQVPPPPERL